jgi:hypothetical protein
VSDSVDAGWMISPVIGRYGTVKERIEELNMKKKDWSMES